MFLCIFLRKIAPNETLVQFFAHFQQIDEGCGSFVTACFLCNRPKRLFVILRRLTYYGQRCIMNVGVGSHMTRPYIIIQNIITEYYYRGDKLMKGVIIMIGGQWVRVPCQMLTDERISKTDIAIFAYIADKLGDSSKALSRADIAAACECSIATVKRAVARLCEYKYLYADQIPGKPTVYRQTILPAKRRGSSKRAEQEQGAAFDTEKYEFVINAIPEVGT